MRTPVKAVLKLAAFIALLAVYFLIGGFDSGGGVWRIVWAGSFIFGAVMALWMTKTVGEIRPVSLRALYVLGGIVLMAWAAFMMLATRDVLGKDTRRSTPPRQEVRP